MPKGKRQSSKAIGRVYNLHTIYRRLNGLYFAGRIRARVEWGKSRGQRSRRSREFGSYYYKERLIRIHPILDQAWVPLYVIEAVMYHEMCHQFCHYDVKNGRRRAHTREFRQLEKQFPYFDDSERWLKANLNKLLRPAPMLDYSKRKIPSKQLGIQFAA